MNPTEQKIISAEQFRAFVKDAFYAGFTAADRARPSAHDAWENCALRHAVDYHSLFATIGQPPPPALSTRAPGAAAPFSHRHMPSSSDDAICGACGGRPDDPSHWTLADAFARGYTAAVLDGGARGTRLAWLQTIAQATS